MRGGYLLRLAVKGLFKISYLFPPFHPQIQTNIQCHAIIILPNTDGIELLVCYEDEGVYVNTYGRITKDVVLQWGEMPTSVGKSKADISHHDARGQKNLNRTLVCTKTTAPRPFAGGGLSVVPNKLYLWCERDTSPLRTCYKG